MIKSILMDNKQLKQPSFISPVNEGSLNIAKNLIDTLMFCWGQGRVSCSLSANQIGENEKIIVVAEKLGGEIISMFNPEIKESKEEMDYWENNMCRPNMLYKNERAYKVLVSFQDEKARWQKCWFSGKMSGIIQQEIDNLNGILPEERAIDALECVERRKNQSELQR